MSEKTPSFASQNQLVFYSTLRQRINEHFSKNNLEKTGNSSLYIKAAVLLSLYIVPYILIFALDLNIALTIVAYILMGIGMAGVGFNVMHDANHGSISNKPWVNELFSYSMDMVGGNAVTWKIQHNVLHHTYTNVYGHDEDIHDKPFLRLAPDGKWSKIHKFQHYYAVILYGLATLSWLTVKDFRAIGNYEKQGLLSKIGAKARNVYANLVISKVIYFAIFIGLPLLIGHHSFYIYLIGFFAMHFVAGLITTTVFQLAHVVEHTDYFQPDSDNEIENSWAVHQLMTTCNFAKKNHLLSWYVGGLNYQVEHHLFPNISHVHYGDIAPIVKQTAKDFKIPYHEIDTFWSAVKSHWGMLKKLGQNELAVA